MQRQEDTMAEAALPLDRRLMKSEQPPLPLVPPSPVGGTCHTCSHTSPPFPFALLVIDALLLREHTSILNKILFQYLA